MTKYCVLVVLGLATGGFLLGMGKVLGEAGALAFAALLTALGAFVGGSALILTLVLYAYWEALPSLRRADEKLAQVQRGLGRIEKLREPARKHASFRSIRDAHSLHFYMCSECGKYDTFTVHLGDSFPELMPKPKCGCSEGRLLYRGERILAPDFKTWIPKPS